MSADLLEFINLGQKYELRSTVFLKQGIKSLVARLLLNILFVPVQLLHPPIPPPMPSTPTRKTSKNLKPVLQMLQHLPLSLLVLPPFASTVMGPVAVMVERISSLLLAQVFGGSLIQIARSRRPRMFFLVFPRLHTTVFLALL